MNRRAFILGGLAALAAPAIIRTPGLLMPVRRIILPEYGRTPAFYVNRTIRAHLNVQDIVDRNMLLAPAREYSGHPIATFRSIPILLPRAPA